MQDLTVKKASKNILCNDQLMLRAVEFLGYGDESDIWLSKSFTKINELI